MNLTELWQELLTGTGVTEKRPDFRFDPDFYSQRYPDIAAHGADVFEHFRTYGKKEGRLATAYQVILKTVPDLTDRLAGLVTDPRLRAAIDAKTDGIFELVFELIALGDPIDQRISDFSQKYYFQTYPDIKKAGLNAFHHYIRFGLEEGRRSLRDIRQNQFKGKQNFDPQKPTCMICVHEFSRSGAPIVGLDIAKNAAQTHNVVVTGLQAGPLLKDFQKFAFAVLVSQHPDEDLSFFALPELDKIDFAILNSVECYLFSKFLVRKSIPFATYLHEFSEYTHPAYKMIFLALFSDLLVFSSRPVRKTWQHIFQDINFDQERDSIIVPQVGLHVDKVRHKERVAARAHLSKLTGIDCSTRRIVYGAGHVQWRKGTDLFVLTAQIAKKTDPDALFVWIGDGLNHEDVYFGVWLDKHLREAGANKADSNLFFLPAGEYYHDVCRASDAFFLSSRLDPLPNVVFDAVRFGCHVVMFKNATGFDDSVYTDREELESVPYGDINAACAALLAAPLKQPNSLSLPRLRKPKLGPSIFTRISNALHERLAEQRYFVVGGGDYDVAIMFSDRENDQSSREKEREKIWSYQRRFVWQSLEEARRELAASDNWIHQNCRIERFAYQDKPAIPDFSVHIHAHYTDNLGNDLSYYAALRQAQRIIVTTDTEDKAARIHHIADHAGVGVETLVLDNQGRDILPFLRLFTQGHAGKDEIWCHIHQKKSIGTMPSGDVWRRFLMAILLGDDKRLSSALAHIAKPDTGLVSAFDPYMADWNASRRLLPEIEPKLPGPIPDHTIVFPVGNMFWTRAGVVAKMNGLFDADYPWPNEPIANDGTVFHLIERLWPAASAMAGLNAVFLEKRDQKRT